MVFKTSQKEKRWLNSPDHILHPHGRHECPGSYHDF